MESRRSDRGAGPRTFANVVVGFLFVLAVAAMLFDHLDRLPWFGGPVYTNFPAVVPTPGGIGIVLLSGDMGLHTGLSPKVSRRLAAAGYPVLAINSLSFAGDKRTPAQVRALVADAATRTLALPGVTRLVMIGQSFGADLLHVGLAGFPAGLRKRVALVILSVPTTTIYLDAGIREYFELGTPDLRPLATAGLLGWVPVLCIHGMAEKASLCPQLTLPNVRTAVLPGAHNLNRDDAALFKVMRAAIVAITSRNLAGTRGAGWNHFQASST